MPEIDNWNTGDLIDWVKEHDRDILRARGEDVTDPYEQYQKLKEMEPEIDQLYADGQIKEAKYKSFKQTLIDCEAKLKEW